MAKVRITVLKRDYNENLAKEYAASTFAGRCPMVQEGQVIDCERHNQPKEICGEAWKAMQHYVYALYHGATMPFGKDWMGKPGVAIVTCNDGLRPVTFKLERIED